MTRPESESADGASESQIASLAVAERAVIVRRVGASLSHALANSLNLIGMRAQMLGLDAQASPAVARASGDIRDHVARIGQLFDCFQQYADALEPPSEAADISAEAESTRRVIGPIAQRRDVRFELVVAEVRPIQLSGAVLRIVMTNLLEFAVGTAPAGSTVALTLSVEPVKRGRGELLSLVMALGVPPEVDVPSDRRLLMDPWLGQSRRTHEQLLLALAVGAVRDRGGWFEPSSEANPAFLLVWPGRT